jgi:H+/gluconate symporter-like permease
MNADGWVKILGAIAAVVAALVATGFVFKFVFKSRQANVTKVKQKDNNVGGDNAGRDINKRG